MTEMHLNGTSDTVTVIPDVSDDTGLDITAAIEANTVERDTLRADLTEQIAATRQRLIELEAALDDLDPPSRNETMALVVSVLMHETATATKIARMIGRTGPQVSAALQGLKRAGKATNVGRAWTLVGRGE
jgi:hypothetical protein